MTPSLYMSGDSPNQTWSVCTCNTCSGHLEFDASRAGETTQCPHCGTDTILFIPSAPTPKPKDSTGWFTMGFFLIGSVLAVGLLIAAYKLASHLAPPSQAESTVAQQADTNPMPQVSPVAAPAAPPPKPPPIQGLFGVKIGEALPPNCILNGPGESADGLFTTIHLTPPEPNPAFDYYIVDLDFKSRLVAKIFAGSNYYENYSEFERVRDAMVAKLDQRYGPSKLAGSGKMWWHSWKRGQREITLTWFIDVKNFTVLCSDESISESVERRKPPVNTHGL